LDGDLTARAIVECLENNDLKGAREAFKTYKDTVDRIYKLKKGAQAFKSAKKRKQRK